MTAGLAWGMTQMHLTRLTAKQMDIRNDMVQVGRCQVPYTAEIKEVMQRWLIVRAGYVQPYIDALCHHDLWTTGQLPGASQRHRRAAREVRR